MPFNIISCKGKRDKAAGDGPHDGKSTSLSKIMSVVELLLTIAKGVKEVPFLETAAGTVQELIVRFEVSKQLQNCSTKAHLHLLTQTIANNENEAQSAKDRIEGLEAILQELEGKATAAQMHKLAPGVARITELSLFKLRLAVTHSLEK